MVCAAPCQRKCAQTFSGAYIFNIERWCLCSFAPDLDNAFACQETLADKISHAIMSRSPWMRFLACDSCPAEPSDVKQFTPLI